jgi:hypothetical protein
LTFSAAYSGTLHLYAVDWDSYGPRGEAVSVDDGHGLPSVQLAANSFVNGAWIHFPINVAAGGSVVITVDNTADAIQALDDYMAKCGFAPGNSQLQVFEYIFTGVEGVHFLVTLPAARASAAYGVTFGPQTEPDTFGVSWDTPTVNDFMLRTSAQVGVGKKITIFVADLQ